MDGWLRAGLAFLAIGSLAVGIWQLFGPQSFYDDFPGAGHQWVSALPPYNEHLMRDAGGLNIALGIVVGWGAVSLQRGLVLAGLIAYLVNALSHFIFHLFNLEGMEMDDQVGNAVTLGFVIVLPSLLLVLAARRT